MANLSVERFGPFTRCVSAVESHVAPAETMAAGQNMLVDPVAGGCFKRGGFLVDSYGETLNASTKRATNGIMESAPEWVPYKMRQFYSDALADGALGGSPTYSVLYGREATSTSWPTVDDGIFGTEYVRRTDANYNLMKEYGSSAYPTDGSNGGGSFATGGIPYTVVPFWYESGAGGYSRGAFELARCFVASGSWGTADAGRWRYYPNFRGTPLRWDGGNNSASNDITSHIRIYPTGPMPPLWPPTVAANGEAAGGRESGFPWVSGDTFYLSVIFQFEDGSYSLPFQPRDVNSILTGGSGFVTVGTIAGSKHYSSLTYSNISIGPPGTIARILVRSPKQTRTATTDPLTVDISDLRVLGVLRNNTQTSYVDTLSDDDGLLQDTDVVRWDLICPPRAQHIGTGDQRVIIGKTLPNQNAIILTAVGTTASDYALNVEDTSIAPGTESALYRVTETGLELISASAAAALATVTIDWATYDTIQKVVDKVNATARDATHAIWKAQVAPGADPTAASSGLCPTVWTTSSSTSAASTALVIDATREAGVPIGYKIYDSAGKIPAGTYITQKLGTGLGVRMSAAASGAGSAAGLVIYADCGDSAAVTTAGSLGWIRVYGPAYPGMVYFRRSALPGYDRPNKDRIYFTISSPGAAATGVSVAANAYGASNRRDGVNQSGQVMGIVDVEGAAVIAYRRRIGLFINQRGSNTAEDFDYRILTINGSQGAVSPWGVIGVAGCAVYPTAVGIKASDKSRREILLSGDIYNVARAKGDFAYEIPLCVLASAQDKADCWMGGAVWGNRIVYAYRRDATTFGFSVYDFSPGADQNGLDAIANPEARQPYGWSTMCQMDSTNDEMGPRAMCAVEASGGLLLYGAINDNNGTNDGRVDRMLNPSQATDNGIAIIGTFQMRRLLAGAGNRLSARNWTVTHKVNYTPPYLAHIRVESGAGGSSTYGVTSSGSNDVEIDRLQLDQKDRSPAKVAQGLWYDDASSTGGVVWFADLELETLPKVGD